MGAHAPTAHAWQQLGKQLRQRRVALQVTQEFLGHWIGANRVTVNRIEQGRHQLRVSHLYEIEIALGIRPGTSLSFLSPRAPAVPHFPRHAPTAIEIATADTLCGHEPNCPHT